MRWWKKAVACGACLAILCSLCGFSGFARECDDLRGRVLRLHILAHSDSAEDQALKLRVRDAVTVAAAGWFSAAQTAGEAESVATRHLPELLSVAQSCVREAGCAYSVSAEITTMYFTARTYSGGTLPAGRYRAVRFRIGEGKGHNWWCVLFPPICVSAAVDSKTLPDVLDREQTAIVTAPQHFRVRLKILEWWESLRQVFSGEARSCCSLR